MPYSAIQTSSKIYLVINEHGKLAEHVTLYLRHCMKVLLNDPKTVSFDCGRLVEWLNYFKKDLYEVTLNDLLEFRDSQRQSLSASTINLKLSTICHFYWFARSKGWCASYLIGINNMIRKERYAIPVEPVTRGGSHFKIPFLLPVPPSRIKSIPTAEQLLKIKDAIAEDCENSGHALSIELNVRNQLMVRWMSEAGLRRQEVTSLHVSDIQAIKGDEILNFDKDVTLIPIVISRGTKFGKTRVVEVEVSLIVETINFIDVERKEFPNHHKVKTVFVSASMGEGTGVIKPGSLTNLIREYEHVYEGATPHAMRRFAISRRATLLYRIERLKAKNNEKYKIDELAILMKLRVFSGHESSDTTLKYYMDLAKVISLDEKEISALQARRNELYYELSEINSQIKASKNLETPI
jgi:integrase